MHLPAQAAKFRSYVKTHLSVRLHMTVILMAVTLTGVLCSKGLELAGLSSLVIRYSINVLVCYIAFLIFIRVWYYAIAPDEVKEKKKDESLDLDLNLDGISLPDLPSSTPSFSGGGGEFGGGGASASFGTPDVVPSGSVSSGDGPGLDLDLNIDADEGIGIIIAALLLVLVLAAVLGAAGFLIYQAPVILPEAAFDLFLAGGLSRTTKRIRTEGWTKGVLKRTWIPFAILFVLSAALGWALDSFCPGMPTLVAAVNGCLL